MYKVGSMFAGIGGICLGFKNAGCKLIWANEIDKFACTTYRENFGSDYLVEGDIKEINENDIPDLDILTAGFPCQAFSIAGYQKGFKDDRGNLFFDVLRVIKAKKPRIVFLENVKNLVSHDKGKTFKVIKESLEGLEYKVWCQVCNTAEYGNVPQNRERVYIVCFREEKDYNEFIKEEFKPIKLKSNIHKIIDVKDKKEAKYYYTEKSKYYEDLKETMKNKDTVYQLRRVYIRENKSNVCPTLTANMGEGGHNVPLIVDNYGIRKLTPRECLLFQGFPKDYKIPEGMADSKIYKQAGNAVSVPVIERIAKKIVKTLDKSTQAGTIMELSENSNLSKIFIKSCRSLHKACKLNKANLSNI